MTSHSKRSGRAETSLASSDLAVKTAWLYYVEGFTQEQIAEKLGVTEGTVKTYLHTVFEKLGISNRTELAIRADEFLSKTG